MTAKLMRHTLACLAYGNFQPPYEECTCGYEEQQAMTIKDSGKRGEMTAEERKQRPLFTGVLRYFPDALMEVAYCSYTGNRQHHVDKPLHWDKSKSTDEADALMRHLAEAGTVDTDGVKHSAKVAWRALALLQRELDAEKENQ